MLTKLGAWTRHRALGEPVWTNVYGLARSLLALSTAMTLLFTPARALFVRGAGAEEIPICSGARSLGAFCVAGVSHLELTRWLAFAALLVIASGWRPRVTALLHWWIAFSFQNNVIVLDGGDQATMVLTALLLPLALTDPRKWHWETLAAPEPLTASAELRHIVAWFAMMMLRVQVAGIYFHAAIAKFGVEEWVDGTAIYYFTNNPGFGATPSVLAILNPILKTGLGVSLVTWTVLIVEYLLSAALFIPKARRAPLLIVGLLLHAGIIVLHGLPSFALAMFAALILYLRPFEQTFQWPKLPSLSRAVSARGSFEGEPLGTR